MKQYITIEQLNELSEKGYKKYRVWFYEGAFRFSTPLMNIGQMIEFLDGKALWAIELVQRDEATKKDELCDVLWEAVKEVLEK